MANYNNVFGNQTLPPSEYKYQALSLTADTTCYWPYNYTGTGAILAKINVISSTGAYTITMPSAAIVSPGEDVLFNNLSAYLITVKDASGGTIGTVAAGLTKYLYLMSNSSAAGTWGIFTFGTGTSAADAASLAGYGTKATGSTLSAAMPMTETPLAYTINTTTDRARGITFTGGSVAATLPAAASAGSDYFCYIKNSGTGTITITPVGGDLVDSSGTVGLNPNDSCFVVSSGTDWHTVGLGRSTIYQFTKLVKDLTDISTYTMTSSDASNKLIQFTGEPSAATTITTPAVVAVYYVQVNTSNAHTVTLKTAAGTGITLAQSSTAILYCDGVNVVMAQTASVSTNVSSVAGILPAANGGTGINSGSLTGIPAITAGTWATAISGTDLKTINSTSILGAGNITTPAWLVPTALKTGAYAANAGELVRLNSAGGAFTVTLPAAPTDGDLIGFEDVTDSCGTFAVLIGANGKNVEFDATGVSINIAGATVIISYNTINSNWKITDTPTPGYWAPVTSSVIKGNGSGGFSAATANTDYLAQFYKSAAAIVVDKGNISAATVTFDYSAGSVQTYTATGSTVTWAVSNWPPTGNEGYLLIRATNQGAYTLAATLVTNWIKPDGTTTGTMATYLAANTGRTALQSAGVDQILLWTRDAGTTVYGKLV